MKITMNDSQVTIERDGYIPVTFVRDGRMVRIVTGVAFVGDHKIAYSLLLGEGDHDNF